MTLLSLVLVIVAAIAFLLGVLQDGLELIYVSIATAIASMVALGIGVVLARRRQAPAAPAGYGTTPRAAPAVARPRRDRDTADAAAGEPAEPATTEVAATAPADEGPTEDEPADALPLTDRKVVRKLTGAPAATAVGTGEPPPDDVDADDTPAADGDEGTATGQEPATPAPRRPAKKAVARRQAAAAPEPGAKPEVRAAPARRPTATSAGASAAPRKVTTTSQPPTTDPEPATSSSRSGSLDDVEGLGPAERRALLARFGSEDAIAAASVTQLTQVPGIGTRLATTLKDVLR